MCPDYCHGSKDNPAAVPQQKKTTTKKLAQIVTLKSKEAVNINANAAAHVHV